MNRLWHYSERPKMFIHNKWEKRNWGDDEEQEAQPAISYNDMYRRVISPKAQEYQDTLEKRANSYLSPGYEALSPAQQNLIYGRIKEQLMPDIERGLKGQMQDITSMGIEGTPGSSIMGNLRQSYLKDLSGRATDVAIKNIDLSRADVGTGLNILGQLRNSLMGEASDISNKQYSGDLYEREYARQLQQAENTQSQGMWSGVGSLFGNIGTNMLSNWSANKKKPSSRSQLNDVLGGSSSYDDSYSYSQDPELSMKYGYDNWGGWGGGY